MLPPLTVVTVRVNTEVSEPVTTVQSEVATSSLVSTGSTSKFIISPSTRFTATVRRSLSPVEPTSQCAVLRFLAGLGETIGDVGLQGLLADSSLTADSDTRVAARDQCS